MKEAIKMEKDFASNFSLNLCWTKKEKWEGKVRICKNFPGKVSAVWDSKSLAGTLFNQNPSKLSIPPSPTVDFILIESNIKLKFSAYGFGGKRILKDNKMLEYPVKFTTISCLYVPCKRYIVQRQ
jgi:hypothetical protein